MKHFTVMFFILALWCAFLPAVAYAFPVGTAKAAEDAPAPVDEASSEEAVVPPTPYHPPKEELILYDEATNTATRLDLESYTERALSAVMAEDSPAEALKAQAVVIRSFALYRTEAPVHQGYDLCTDPNCCYPVSTAVEGHTAAVAATAGELLSFDGKPIYGLSHLSSCISTEGWGEGYPYLAAVRVEDESSFECYKTLYSFKTEALLQKLSLPPTTTEGLGDIKFTQGNRVLSICFGGKEYGGGEFASLLGLDSLCFTLSPADGGFDISCYGSGHGYGMSRCTAMLMAASGAAYGDILARFYPQTTPTAVTYS